MSALKFAKGMQFEDGYHSAVERAAAKARRIKMGACQRLSHRQREATPPEFRDLLLSIARTARPERITA